MIGPGLIGLVISPITAILLFSLGAFAHQMLSSLLYALVTDAFEKQDVATATGFGGMAGYLGGTSFSLLIGELATTIGYEPCSCASPSSTSRRCCGCGWCWARGGARSRSRSFCDACRMRGRAEELDESQPYRPMFERLVLAIALSHTDFDRELLPN